MNGPYRPDVSRVVRPRKHGNADLPIITTDGARVLLERGEVYRYDELPAIVRAEPSSLVAAHHVGHIVRDLDQQLGDDPKWQFRLAPLVRELYAPNRERKTYVRETVVKFFGFSGRGVKGKRNETHYHYPLSPLQFVRLTAHELIPGDESELEKLLAWARDIRTYLVEQRLKVSPTSGGIAGQLLRDPRFYPDARRKVPTATNARARDHLPGNFYRLYGARVGEYYDAYYLDQRNAHHSIAAHLQFPDANSLYAKGRFNNLSTDRPWKTYKSPTFEKIMREHGLFYVKAYIPRRARYNFPPPCMDKPGQHYVFIFSNELPDFYSLGGTVLEVIAAWSSPDADAGLNRYAEWSLSELSALPTDTRRHWLKPTLLATYGILAAKPRRMEFGYKRAVNGAENAAYPVGSGYIDVQVKRTVRNVEMPTANVIHRAMIEAETRLRSLRLARVLAHNGFDTLAIYADSVFVRNDGRELPLYGNWRIQDRLDQLRFISSTAFTSKQLSKTPGITRDERADFIRRGRGSRAARIRQAATMTSRT